MIKRLDSDGREVALPEQEQSGSDGEKDSRKTLLEGVLSARYIRMGEKERDIDVAAFPAIKRALGAQGDPLLEKELALEVEREEAAHSEAKDEKIPELFRGIGLERDRPQLAQEPAQPAEPVLGEDEQYEWQEQRPELSEEELLDMIERYEANVEAKRYRSALEARAEADSAESKYDPYNQSFNSPPEEEITEIPLEPAVKMDPEVAMDVDEELWQDELWQDEL